MKVFEFVLSSYDQSIGLIVAAESEEQATKRLTEEYGLERDEDALSIESSSEIPYLSSSEFFVREIFNTNML